MDVYVCNLVVSNNNKKFYWNHHVITIIPSCCVTKVYLFTQCCKAIENISNSHGSSSLDNCISGPGFLNEFM